MATIRLLVVLSLACIGVFGYPSQTDLLAKNTTIFRNTIFADERFKGEVFENVDAFNNVELTPTNEVISPYRLPTTTKPSHYNILWILDFSRPIPTQSGTVDIQLAATQPGVNEIVIHTHELVLTRVELHLNNVNVPITYVEQPQYHFLRVTLTQGTLNYNVNNTVIYTLSIDFGANLRDDMYGIYRSWFRNSPTDQEVKWMASTQFQATSARTAFPCYDEPKFKATFDITIRRPVAYSSWSCTRRKNTTTPIDNAYRDDIYHTTPVMSTYLLAIIVAEFESISESDANGNLLHEVIARPGAIHTQGQYAQTVGQALLAEMNNHTAYNFYTQHPQLKMTQAAIPDFGAGAMENWGLLTYREAYLMRTEEDTNGHFQQRVAYILSHEIAHMWFGNLVTNDWWDVLWLNEGFARYYQYYLTAWVQDYGLATRFITEQVHASLLSDSANNPHPLTNPGVASPAAVSAMFSTITYNKGAAVIRMTEHLLGSEVHRAGLRNYLRGKEFDTALPIDLFNYLEQAGNAVGALNYDFSFVDYYKSWTEQPGHPVLNVYVNHTTGDITIYQRRFNINTGYSNNTNNNYIVPITFATASNPDFENTKPTHIISKAVTVINRGSVGDEWVIFNKQQTGFYRVNYDDYTWNLIILALRGANRTIIHEYNRAQIVNDVFQFARSGLMAYSRAFNILSFLENETDYAPWVAAMTGFTWLRNRLASSTTAAELARVNALIVRWATTVMNSITYIEVPGESFMRSYLRYQLAPIMCQLEVPACLESARTQFQALRAQQSIPVPPDSRNWVYCSALRQGDAADFNFLWARFQGHNVYTEKILILETIGCTKHAASLNTFLTAIVSDNFIIRPQDYTTAFNSAVSGNEENTEIVFAFIRNNPTLVASAFSNSLATPLSYISARLRSRDAITAYETWVRANQQLLGNAYQGALNGATSTLQSIEWAEEVSSDINNYVIPGVDEVYTTSTAAPPTTVTVTTTQQPSLTEPATPSLPEPNSAATLILSVAAVGFTVLVNIIL